MSEPVLKSIIQLMAISASVDGVISASEKRVITDFIQEQLSAEATDAFIQLFNEYADIALAGHIQTINICKRINEELNQKQKIIVLFHLLELVNSDGNLHSDESNFIDEVAQAFNIDEHEYSIIKAFVIDDDALKLGLQNILIISSQKFDSKIKHVHRPNFKSSVGILRIPSVEMYMLKYFAGETDTYLNGFLLKDRHIYTFSNGSSIRADLIDPIYYSDVVSNFLQEQNVARITFEASHVYYTFRGGKIGLRDINVTEESGKLIGIMGASGSGKSTLINVLNGNEAPLGGKVLINGVDIHDSEEKSKIRGVVGYVPQDDLLIEELTVYQNLYYAAKLCFGHYQEEEIDELVIKTLVSLGLLEAKNLKVGSSMEKIISGGQRKRLNIGLELLREPSILFIDEPTSGLSSNDSENILDLLKELSLKGKLIFVVIHQPSSDIFKMFDKLIILDVGGYQIYYGNPIEAVTYFKDLENLINSSQGVCPTCGNVNPEQIFNIIETKIVDEYGRYTPQRKVSPTQWHKYFKERISLPKVEAIKEPPKSTLHLPSRFRQFMIFSFRDILAKLSNAQYMAIGLLEAPLLAVILAYIVRFYRVDQETGNGSYVFSENMNVPAYIFMSIIVALFIGLTISAEEIFKDAKILKRERFLHLSHSSYLFSKIFILFAFSAYQTMTFVLVGALILGIKGMTFTYWMVLFSIACNANMMGLNISRTFNSVITIYILIPLLIIPQLILGGIVVKFENVNPQLASENNVPWISEFMVSRWSFEALAVSQFKDNPHERGFYEYDHQMATADYKKVYFIPTLESKLSYCLTHIKDNDDKVRNKVQRDLKILRNEVGKELKKVPGIQLKKYPELSYEGFDFAVGEATKVYLKKLRLYYVRMYNKASKAKDRLIRERTKTKEGKAAFLSSLNRYHNKQVADMVKNTSNPLRISESDGKLIQHIYPVFQDPDNVSNLLDFRAHFFAPRKHFMGFYIDTLWFNLGAIWFATLMLFISLYFKLFKRVLTFLSFRKSFR
ncbi:ATP-binding cassette domain-containing protein [uncultured Microscilla sp.]|uniref:ATP-binding cassette domain-containing protein n=1 Tax=uncultured Microscilla sp. TaxID=432653 RepID=UPI00262B5938|nr:ATP-binding cassette domain-containing protein [uncultured Microscilla sp.]